MMLASHFPDLGLVLRSLSFVSGKEEASKEEAWRRQAAPTEFWPRRAAEQAAR